MLQGQRERYNFQDAKLVDACVQNADGYCYEPSRVLWCEEGKLRLGSILVLSISIFYVIRFCSFLVVQIALDNNGNSVGLYVQVSSF